MTEEDDKIIEMMEKYGGSFVKALSNCARYADSINFVRLKETFNEYFVEYNEFVRRAENKVN